MNRAADGIVERQVDAMLKLIRMRQTTAAAAILDQAHAVAGERLRAARASARHRVHEVAVGLRGEVDVRLTRLRAGEQAEEREQRLARDALALAEGRTWLREALLERWSDPGSRRRWWSSLLGEAARILPAGQWEIAVPPDWPDDERAEMLRLAADAAGETPATVEAGDVAAGLRISVGDAVLDGTAEGLLERTAELDARLLAAFHKRLETGAEP